MAKPELPKCTELPPGLYRHYKGNDYTIIGTARHSETMEDLVYYECLYDNELSRYWVRPLEMFRGTIDSAEVHPREVVKEALRCNAAAVIFSHNHPSGNPEPSQADRQITQRLKEALALVDVRVIDHVVAGRNCTTSFAERGLL